MQKLTIKTYGEFRVKRIGTIRDGRLVDVRPVPVSAWSAAEADGLAET